MNVFPPNATYFPLSYPTGIHVNHSTTQLKAKTENNNYEIRNEKHFGTLHLL